LSGRHGAFNVTVGIGISEPGFADIDITNALKRADAALYEAKQNGRNRVEIAALKTNEPSLAVA